MANLDLSKYGIQDVKEIIHNPSYDVLFAEETKPGLEGFEKGQVTELGAVNVMTGIYTGRSPKDKFFVMNEASKDSVWWTSEEYKNDNKPCSEEAWADLKAKAVKELSGKRLFVVDTFCGANPATRMKVRFIMEVAWQAHFVTNMFIRPTAEELANYGEPDFVSFNASKAKVDNYKELGLNSETATVFNLKTNEQVILNTWYGGEMKKGMFSIMNYKNPLRGIASMHCSANTNMEGTDSAIFFGLSGTGKTTLSTDPKRLLIGDDEHGWDDEGVFNYEGGCYAKVINLDKESEPDIYEMCIRDSPREHRHDETAQHRTAHHAERHEARQQAERAAALTGGKGLGDDAHVVRHGRCAADALNRARRHERRQRGRHTEMCIRDSREDHARAVRQHQLQAGQRIYDDDQQRNARDIAEHLDVAIAYGNQDRRMLTSAVSSIDNKELIKSPATSIIIATTFVVEYTFVIPSVFVVTDQQTFRVS